MRRELTWCGLRPGDAVVVNTAKERRHTYEFVAYGINVATGDEWVELRGGRAGEEKYRSFRPELIHAASARKGGQVTGPPLIDAPRLPFFLESPKKQRKRTT